MTYQLYISPETERLLSIDDKDAQNALRVFYWMHDDFRLTQDCESSNYKILTLEEYYDKYKGVHPERTIDSKYYCIIRRIKQLDYVLHEFINKEYKWVWKFSKDKPAYEVTSRGDKRFSPFFQYKKVNNKWISLEDYYKNYIKPQKEAGTYVEGTGHRLMTEYLMTYKGLIYELAIIGSKLPFSDMFDKDGGQNKWYSEIMNNYINALELE